MVCFIDIQSIVHEVNWQHSINIDFIDSERRVLGTIRRQTRHHEQKIVYFLGVHASEGCELVLVSVTEELTSDYVRISVNDGVVDETPVFKAGLRRHVSDYEHFLVVLFSLSQNGLEPKSLTNRKLEGQKY